MSPPYTGFDMETIEVRVAALEKAVKLWKSTSLCLFALIALAAAVGWRTAKPGKVTATEFQLVDSKGAVRGDWRVLEGKRPDTAGTILKLNGAEGKSEAYLFTYDSFGLYGQPCNRLCLGTGGSPSLIMESSGDGSPTITMYDKNSKQTWKVP